MEKIKVLLIISVSAILLGISFSAFSDEPCDAEEISFFCMDKMRLYSCTYVGLLIVAEPIPEGPALEPPPPPEASLYYCRAEDSIRVH